MEKEERLLKAIEAYNDALKDPENPPSYRRIATQYDVSDRTLRGRIQGTRQPKHVVNSSMQRLSVIEENSIERWIVLAAEWGWPLRIEDLHSLAKDILVAKGDMADLGVNWHLGFLQRHPDLKSVFSRKLDQSRYLASSLQIIEHWFQLYNTTIEKYGIATGDIYNMDEKGIMHGVIASSKIIIPHIMKTGNVRQPGNREWTTLVECISTRGQHLPPMVVFKGKRLLKEWFQDKTIKGTVIAISEKGWTDK